MDAETTRIKQWVPDQLIQKWEKWGPFVASRAWGTVREDYSADGDAWNFFPHDHARRRAYRWGEDAIAGLCDRFQVLLFAPTFWNGADPILKERLFGLGSQEGNHGEDVKELYYQLDGTPTGSYLKYLYKYPQAAYPYDLLIQTNGARGTLDREFELIDTGIFDQNQYFDIFIEYGKADAEDYCMRIEAINRGPDPAPLHLLPQLWFRNQWNWSNPRLVEPTIQLGPQTADAVCLVADDSALPSPKILLGDYHLGKRYLYASVGGDILFTNNETDCESIWATPNASPYVKDGIEQYIIHDKQDAVNPGKVGTKAAIHYFFPAIEAGKSIVIYMRLASAPLAAPLADVESILAKRKKEADAFYNTIHPPLASDEEKMIQRQAFASLNNNKQIYFFSVARWMVGDVIPPPPSHKTIRNTHWYHVASIKILSMPDKWEYPWFAAWDLAFHTISLALVDIEYAKQQLTTLLIDRFQHPNGQIPAYEWEFSDVNPPVQAWAALRLFEIEKTATGKGDRAFLEKCFHRLLLNFAWWVNKVDQFGNNAFEGGFLGMDNIDLFNRDAQLPPGFSLDEVDGAGWISKLCLNMMTMALILAEEDPVYEGMGIKFLYHFVYVTAAMRKGQWRNYDLFDEKDGFFYSFLRHPDGSAERFPVRSLEGVIPFFACEVWDEEDLKKFPKFYLGYQWLVQKRPELADICIQSIPQATGNKHFFGLLSPPEICKFLSVLWNPNEFRSDYGLRSLSKFHQNNPVTMQGYTITYEPGESIERMMGGNSNWRGPIWFPINFLLIKTLLKLSDAFEDTLQIQVDGEPQVTVHDMAVYYAEALLKIFKQDAQGNRPVFGDTEKFQTDPNFKDYLFFFEHFHGDTGRGLGASQQGWTALIVNLIQEIRK